MLRWETAEHLFENGRHGERFLSSAGGTPARAWRLDINRGSAAPARPANAAPGRDDDEFLRVSDFVGIRTSPPLKPSSPLAMALYGPSLAPGASIPAGMDQNPPLAFRRASICVPARAWARPTPRLAIGRCRGRPSPACNPVRFSKRHHSNAFRVAR